MFRPSLRTEPSKSLLHSNEPLLTLDLTTPAGSPLPTATAGSLPAIERGHRLGFTTVRVTESRTCRGSIFAESRIMQDAE
jgi:hypothetical protein